MVVRLGDIDTTSLGAPIVCLFIIMRQLIALLLDEVSVSKEELLLRWPIIGDGWLRQCEREKQKAVASCK